MSVVNKIDPKEIRLVPLSEIKLNPKNRNSHPQEQIDRFVKVLRANGFRTLPVISIRSGFLVCGEGRYLAMKQEGMTEMLCSFQPFEDEAEEYAHAIADNALQEWSSLDRAGINQDILDLGPFDIDNLGLKDFVVDLSELNDPEEKGEPDSESETEDQEKRIEENEEIPEKIEPRTKLHDHFRIGAHELFNGDCLERMKLLQNESVHALVSDPPAGIAFMGKDWDEDKGGGKEWTAWMTRVMEQTFRVLKPGAHGLVWAIPRTSHWTATALENAGFEIRDVVTHVFGCLSEDTELYCNGKWTPYYEVNQGDQAICYDVNKRSFTYGSVEETFVYDYDDTAYRIQSNHTDQIVSRNHRCIVERNGRFLFEFAEEAACKQEIHIPILEDMSALLHDLSCDEYDSSDSKQNMFNEMRRDTCKKNEAYKNEASSYLSNLQKSIYAEKSNGVRQSNPLQLKMLRNLEIQKSRDFSPSQNNIETGNISWKYTRESAEAVDADGEKPRLEGRCHLQTQQGKLHRAEICEMSERIYSNGSQGWLRDGTSSRCSYGFESMPNTNRNSSSCESHYSRQSIRELNAFQKQSGSQIIRGKEFTRTDLARIEPFHYSGKVWCVKVHTGAFVARRNGKIFVTGNSGFPKSHDISKAIDKAAGAEREVVGKSKSGSSSRAFQSEEQTTAGEYETTAPSTPDAKKWAGFGTALKPASEHWILVRKPCSEDTVAKNVLKHGTGGINIDASRIESCPNDPNIRNNKTRGEGFRTEYVGGEAKWDSTRPHWEAHRGRFPANFILSHNPDCVEAGTKKVKSGTAGKNSRAFGDGNIFGTVKEFKPNGTESYANEDGTETVASFECTESCAVAELDRISIKNGVHLSGKGRAAGTAKQTANGGVTSYVLGQNPNNGMRYQDSDNPGASRFFYCAKPSKREKNEGVDESITKAIGARPNSGDLTGKFPDHDQRERVGNFHPTVKSLKLMSYLINMVTPPGGTLIDPFGGSGTTLVAAELNGFNSILFEQSPEYCDIILARAEKATGSKPELMNG